MRRSDVSGRGIVRNEIGSDNVPIYVSGEEVSRKDAKEAKDERKLFFAGFASLREIDLADQLTNKYRKCESIEIGK